MVQFLPVEWRWDAAARGDSNDDRVPPLMRSAAAATEIVAHTGAAVIGVRWATTASRRQINASSCLLSRTGCSTWTDLYSSVSKTHPAVAAQPQRGIVICTSSSPLTKIDPGRVRRARERTSGLLAGMIW